VDAHGGAAQARPRGRGGDARGRAALRRRPAYALLDPATFLPVRIEIVMPDCGAESPAKLEYSDWRPVGGVLRPFVERFGMDGASGVTT
jgi:hypothetical protein